MSECALAKARKHPRLDKRLAGAEDFSAMNWPTRLAVLWLAIPTLLAAVIPAEDFFRPSSFSSPTLSPDGTRVAYLLHEGWKGGIGVMNLADKQVTFIETAKKESVGWVRWAGNQRLVFGINVETDTATSSGAYDLGGLYAVDSDGGRPRELVPSLVRQFLGAERRGFRGSSGASLYGNSRPHLVHLLPKDPNHILVSFTKLEPVQENGAVYRLKSGDSLGVYRVNLHTGTRAMVEEVFGHVQGWLADREGNVRLAISVEADHVDYFHRPVGEKAWQKIFSRRLADPEFEVLGFDGTGEKLQVTTDRDRDTTALYAFDLARREFGLPLLALADHDVMDSADGLSAGALRFNRRTRQLAGVTYHTDRPRFHALDPEEAKFQELLQQSLPDFAVTVSSESEDGGLAILTAYSDRRPEVHFLLNRATGTFGPLGSSRPWLRSAQLSPTRPIAFPTRDGLTVHGYLTQPVGDTSGKPPLVVLPHGGPWLRDLWGFDSEVQFLASRGYAVLQVNFRGSLGYGRKFLEAGYKEWGAAMQDDLTDGVKWVVSQGLVDPDRVGIYGASYGGFAAMAGLCFTPELYRCGINACGVTDLRTFMNTIPEEQRLLRANMERLVGDPDRDEELMKRRSPQHNLQRIQVPVLLAYGQEDSIVDKKQGDRFHRELKRNGKDVTYLVFPDEGHGFFRRENQLRFYAEVERFLERHLKSAPPRKP